MLENVLDKIDNSVLDEKYNLSFSFRSRNPLSELIFKLAKTIERFEPQNFEERRSAPLLLKKIRKEAAAAYRSYNGAMRRLFARFIPSVGRDLQATQTAFAAFFGTLESKRRAAIEETKELLWLLQAEIGPDWQQKFKALKGRQLLLFFEAALEDENWREKQRPYLLKLYRYLVRHVLEKKLNFVQVQRISQLMERHFPNAGRIRIDFDGESCYLNRLEAAYSCAFLCEEESFQCYGVPPVLLSFIDRCVHTGELPEPEGYSLEEILHILTHLRIFPLPEQFVATCFTYFEPAMKKGGCHLFPLKEGYGLKLLPCFSSQKAQILLDPAIQKEVSFLDVHLWEGIDDWFIEQILLHFPNLEKTVLPLPENPGVEFARQLQAAPRLKKLHLHLSSFEKAPEIFTLPERIAVQFFGDGEASPSFAMRFSGLKKFTFYSSSLQEKEIAELGKNCFSCRELAFSVQGLLQEGYFKAVAENFSKLKRLKIQNGCRIPNILALAPVFQKCLKLERLSIGSGHSRIGDLFRIVGWYAKNLRKMSLQGRTPQYEEIATMAKSCPALQKIVFKNGALDPEKLFASLKSCCRHLQIVQKRGRIETLLQGRLAVFAEDDASPCNFEQTLTIISNYDPSLPVHL